MRTLLFKNNVHNTEAVDIPGREASAVNLTVRKGLKWSNLVDGEKVYLQEAPSEDDKSTLDAETQVATIFDVKVMCFNDLMSYPKMLLLEHEPVCQTYRGLYETMRKVYDGFLAHELVTLVFYEIDQ
jgi:hypothetical protein